MKLDAKKKIAAEFSSTDARVRQAIEASREGILRLASLSDLNVGAERLPQSGGAVRSTALFDVRIAYVTEGIDVEAEAACWLQQHQRDAEGLPAKGDSVEGKTVE